MAKKIEKVPCPNCGNVVEAQYIFECPECGREGCGDCIMLAGKGCRCIECEETE